MKLINFFLIFLSLSPAYARFSRLVPTNLHLTNRPLKRWDQNKSRQGKRRERTHRQSTRSQAVKPAKGETSEKLHGASHIGDEGSGEQHRESEGRGGMHLCNAWLPPPVAEETKREAESFAAVVRSVKDSWRPDDPDSVYSTFKWISVIDLWVHPLSISPSSLVHLLFPSFLDLPRFLISRVFINWMCLLCFLWLFFVVFRASNW